MESAAPSSQPDFGVATFETALGRCAIAWRGARIVGTALPGPDLSGLIAHRFPDASELTPPPFVGEAINGIIALLGGEPADFSDLPLDFGDTAPFERAVYAATSAIPRGQIRTYGELAAGIGTPGAARAVGGALGRNPFPIIVPCHRVLAAGGRSGGFSAPGGAATKFRLLAIEGARRTGAPELFEALPLAVRP